MILELGSYCSSSWSYSAATYLSSFSLAKFQSLLSARLSWRVKTKKTEIKWTMSSWGIQITSKGPSTHKNKTSLLPKTTRHFNKKEVPLRKYSAKRRVLNRDTSHHQNRPWQVCRALWLHRKYSSKEIWLHQSLLELEVPSTKKVAGSMNSAKVSLLVQSRLRLNCLTGFTT